MSHKLHLYTLAIILGIATLVVGCTSSQNSQGGTTYTRTANGSYVTVVEDEYHIHMPTAFPAGVVTFHITNMGEHAHNFKITGMGVAQQLASDIPPGGTMDMNVSLAAGTYHVICPIIGHADLGMRLDVTAFQP